MHTQFFSESLVELELLFCTLTGHKIIFPAALQLKGAEFVRAQNSIRGCMSYCLFRNNGVAYPRPQGWADYDGNV